MEEFFKVGFIVGDHDKIVRVSDILLHAQSLFHELVELAHVEIRKKLGCEIADRDSFAVVIRIPRRPEAPNDFAEQPERINIFDRSFEDGKQDGVIDRSKELMNVALEREASRSVIPACLPQITLEGIDRLMRSLSFPAGKGVRDERRLEDRIQYLENGMVEDAIADACFVDAALLGIANHESLVRPVLVLPGTEIPVEGENILLELPLKFLHILSGTFASAEFLPSKEQVLWRDDAVEDTLVHFHE